MDAGAHDLLGQAALGEKFLQQGVVGFRDVLDELLVQNLAALLPFARRRRLRVFARAVGRVGADLAAQHIQHLVETGAGIDRHLHRENLRAEPLADLLDEEVVVHVLLVERIDDNDLGDAELRGVVPHHLGADPDAVAGMNDDDREIDDAEGVERLAAEVEVTRGVDDVEPAALPLEAKRRGMNRNLPLLLAHVVVGHGRALDDAAHAANDIAAHEHGFRQHCLARGSMTYDGEVTNISRLIGFHKRVI